MKPSLFKERERTWMKREREPFSKAAQASSINFKVNVSRASLPDKEGLLAKVELERPGIFGERSKQD